MTIAFGDFKDVQFLVDNCCESKGKRGDFGHFWWPYYGFVISISVVWDMILTIDIKITMCGNLE